MLARAGALTLAALLLGGTPASAQVDIIFNRTGSGARAAGMANAFIAISDDGTAASWNPAGLGQLRNPELSLVSTTSEVRHTAAGFRTRDDLSTFTPVEASYRDTYPDFVSLAAPVTLWGKPVTFQAAWRRLYALNYRENVSTTREPQVPEAPPPLRIDSSVDLLGGVDLVSLAGAVKLTPRLALGGSFNLWRGDWTEEHFVGETLLAPPAPTSFATVTQSNRVRGENVSLGLMLTYPRWSIGLLHQGPLRSDFTGRVTTTTSEAAPPSPQEAEGELLFPRSIGVGSAWRPAPRWTVALDLTWDEWRQAVIDTTFTGRINLLDGLPQDRTSTRNTVTVNAGAEHLFVREGFVIPLRFGAAWEPQGWRSPYTRDTVDFVMLALGTGYNTNSLKFDAGLQVRWANYLTATTFGISSAGALPEAVGERGTREWRLKLSVIVRLTDTDKLRDVVRKVF